MKKLFGFLLVICLLASVLLLVSCMSHSGGSYADGDYMGAPSIGGSVSSGKGESAGAADSAPMGPEIGSADAGDGVDSSVDDGEAEEPADKPEDKPVDNIRLPSGMITAGAQNDNQYYNSWIDLFSQGETENGKFFNYTNPAYSWGFNSLNRVKVTVKTGSQPVAGATVVASDEQGNTLFSAVSDAEGNAYLFTDAANGTITVTSGAETETTRFNSDERNLEVQLSGSGIKLNVIEIMLVVDVTGSMGDELSFLKAELDDVITRIAAYDSKTTIRLAMLFYRDTDDRVPFDYYDFIDVTDADGLAKQQATLDKQHATGGGDDPEAVDEALDIAVNKQWSTGATTKIIFHLLDAPAHSGDKYETKLVNATKTAAEKGIRICPIICSGAAELTEYTMREAAIYTGGTFIFVTDDSGIGNSHHDPDLPNVTVELLNSLMVRIVKGYHTGVFEEPIYWKQDPNLGINN